MQRLRSVCSCGVVHTGEFPLQVSSRYPRGSPGLGAGVCRHYPKRGSQAVHDGLLNYKPLEGCAHGLCNAHHLRELVYIHEDFREKAFDGWAAEMGALLCQANS